MKFLTNEGRKSSKGAANNALKGRTRSHAGHYIRYVEVDEDLNEDQNVSHYSYFLCLCVFFFCCCYVSRPSQD